MVTPTDLILVCVLPAPRDLEIARLLGWYRIPFRTAPKVVAVDFLAFYQPGTFGDSGGRLEYLAPVRGHELTTRAEQAQMYKADLPEVGISPEILIALLGIQEAQAPYDVEKLKNGDFD